MNKHNINLPVMVEEWNKIMGKVSVLLFSQTKFELHH